MFQHGGRNQLDSQMNGNPAKGNVLITNEDNQMVISTNLF